MDADLEVRLAALEGRVRELEDMLAIQQIIARYGPAVDSLSQAQVAALWARDGVYDFGGEPLRGAEAVGKLVELSTHRAYVERGCLHSLGNPVITIQGDHAVATGNSRVYVHEDDGWKVERAAANRWELVRDGEGWKVASRTNRLLDGTEDARLVLRSVDRPLK